MNSQLLKQILNELAASQVHWLLWFSSKWAVVGALVGLTVGIVSILLFKRVGWYRSGWRFAGWVRWPHLQDGLPGALFHHALAFGRKFIVERKIRSEVKDRKLEAFYDRARNGLLAAAKAGGAPETVSRRDL